MHNNTSNKKGKNKTEKVLPWRKKRNFQKKGRWSEIIVGRLCKVKKGNKRKGIYKVNKEEN